MDWLKYKQNGLAYLKKYRMIVLIVLSGLLLMWVPEKQDQQQTVLQEVTPQKDLQKSLKEILSLVHGAGKVEVLLTEKTGAQTLYQTDVALSRGETSEERQNRTVMIRNSAREEDGLIKQINPPILQGAVVVCQGGDDPKVKLAIVEAVTRATGLPSSCVSVLKMK